MTSTAIPTGQGAAYGPGVGETAAASRGGMMPSYSPGGRTGYPAAAATEETGGRDDMRRDLEPGHDDQQPGRQSSGAGRPHMHNRSSDINRRYASTGDGGNRAGERSFRKFGNPFPLGLASFSITLFVFSMINVNTRSLLGFNTIGIGLAFFLGGAILLLAGIWEFIIGHTFDATVFASFAGFWISLAAIYTSAFGIRSSYSPDLDGGAAFNSAIGIFYIAWFIYVAMLTIASLRTTVIYFGFFFIVDIVLLMLAIGSFKGMHRGFIKAAGAFGIIASFLGFFLVLGDLLTRETSFFILPKLAFPWSPDKKALKKDVDGEREEEARWG